MASAAARRAIIGVIAVTGAAWASACEATPKSFTVALTGAAQVPPVQTPGAGEAKLTYDPANRKVTWSITYSGLSSPATMAHFHGPAAADKNAPVTLWLMRQGTPIATPIQGGGTLTREQAEQFEGGQWYVNVHTKEHPDGEIRGQIIVPKD